MYKMKKNITKIKNFIKKSNKFYHNKKKTKTICLYTSILKQREKDMMIKT